MILSAWRGSPGTAASFRTAKAIKFNKFNEFIGEIGGTRLVLERFEDRMSSFFIIDWNLEESPSFSLVFSNKPLMNRMKNWMIRMTLSLPEVLAMKAMKWSWKFIELEKDLKFY